MLLASMRKLFLAPVRPAARPPIRTRSLRVEGLEDRAVPAVLFVDDDGAQKPGAFTTIGAAMAAAGTNDTIEVFDGTYTESVTITKNGIKLVARNVDPSIDTIIQAPATATPYSVGGENIGAAVVDVRGATKVRVEGFKISGASNTDGNVYAGVRVIDGGSATIRDNRISGLTGAADANFGFAVQIGTNRGGGSAGTAKIDNNVLSDYLKGGILVDGTTGPGANANATIKDNIITGGGEMLNAQYGVQISRNASARVEKNLITNHVSNSPSTAAAGVFVFQSTSGKNLVARNDLDGNQTGVLADGVQYLQIINNDITASGDNGGITMFDSHCNEIKNNDIDGSGADGIALFDSSNNEIKNNELSNNGLSGIYVQGGTGNMIRHNESFCNEENGIQLVDSSHNFLWNNDSWGNGIHGVYVSGGGYNDIWCQDNSANIEDGIRLEDTVCNTVVGNALQSNGGYGLSLHNADNTFIALNLITGNGEGSIFIDAESTGTVACANRLDEPITKEAIGSDALTESYSSATADADAATADLD